MITWEKPIGAWDNMAMVPMMQPCAMCKRGLAIMNLQQHFQNGHCGVQKSSRMLITASFH